MAVNVGTAVAYLDLNMTSFNSGIQQAQSALQTLASDTESISNKMISAGGLLTNVGSSITRNVTVPIASLGESSVQAYRDFESAFAGVKKTIDESRFKEYSVTWDDLSNAIKQMAQETGISAEEIAGVMEVAGQLGVELGDGGKNIIEFTRQMTMLGVATDMTAQDASLSLARFANITGLFNTTTEESSQNVKGLGSAITALGNNFATQEAEIVNMSTRLASAGTVSGLTAQEILALATAMSSAGIKAEAGGSSMSTTLTNLEQIVQGVAENAEEKLETLGYISGMGAEKFAETWKNKPIEAITAFIKGLGNANLEGESMVLFLDELGMKSIRQSNMLRALALSADNMSDALKVSNQNWNDAYSSMEQSGALVEEFNKRLETLDSRLSMLNETWKDVKREIAEVLLPYLEQIMDKVKQLLSWWKQLDDGTKEMIVKVTAVVAAVGPLLMMLGGLVSSIGAIAGGLGALSPVVGGIVGLFGNFGTTIGAVKNMFTVLLAPVKEILSHFHLLNGVLKLLGGAVEFCLKPLKGLFSVIGTLGGKFLELLTHIPVIGGAFKALGSVVTSLSTSFGGILVVIGLVIAAIIDLWNNNEQFRENVIRIWNAIKDFFISVWDALKPIFDLLIQVLGAIIKAIEPLIEILVAVLAPILEMIVAVLKPIIQIISEIAQAILGALVLALNTIIPLINTVVTIVGGVIRLIAEIISGIMQVVGVLLGVLANALHKVGEIWKTIWETAVKVFDNTVGVVIRLIKGFVDGIVNIFKTLFDVLLGDPIIIDIANGIVKWFTYAGEMMGKLFKAAVDLVISIATFLKDTIGGLIEAAVNVIVGAFTKMKEGISNIVENVKEKVAEFAGKVKEGFDHAKEVAINFFKDMIGKIGEWKDKWIARAKEAAQGFVNGFKEKTGNAAEFFKNFFNNALNLIKSKTSDFMSAGKNLASKFADGFKNAWNSLTSWVSGAVSTISSAVSGVVNGIKNVASNVSSKVKTVVNGKHKDGLDYVPFDGYIAELHKGERVLTADENKRYSNGDGTTINFYSNEKIDEYTAARELKRTMHDIELGLV